MNNPNDIQLNAQELINNTLGISNDIIARLTGELGLVRTQLAQVMKELDEERAKHVDPEMTWEKTVA